MSLFPLWNSLRIAAIASVLIFFAGIGCAYWASKLPRVVKGALDVFLTLPMVLPPTVCGYFLLLILGVKRPLGALLDSVGHPVRDDVAGRRGGGDGRRFPADVPHRRGAFEAFDESLASAAKTLGLSNRYIFWRIRMPACRQGILAGTVLAFARALGEYGATSMLIGYTPGGRRPSRPPSISSGAPTTRRARCCG